MEKSQILALGTGPDWYFLKKHCKSQNISAQISLYFLDDWVNIQKSHLNQYSNSITYIFYLNSSCFTNETYPIPSLKLLKNPCKKFTQNTHKKYIEWEISFSKRTEKILIELNFLACPRTCENFWQISTGHEQLSYVKSKIHRSVKNCFIEGGIIESRLKSIYIDYFPDENFNYRHKEAGIIGMVKSETGGNGTRFYITLRPIEYFDGKLVAFGKVVEGLDTIRMISELNTSNQVLTEDAIIVKSSEYLSSQKNKPERGRKNSEFRELANELLRFV